MNDGVAPILILGLGNLLLRDEGVGVHAAQVLARAQLPPEIEVCDGGTAGLALLDVLADRRKVVVIDAVDAAAPPGTILRLAPAHLMAGGNQAVSLHELGLLETLQLARRLGWAPDEVVILGVVPQALDAGLELSPPVQAVLSVLMEMALTEAGAVGWGCDGQGPPGSCGVDAPRGPARPFAPLACGRGEKED